MKPRGKTGLLLAFASLALLGTGFFIFSDLFWSWTHLDNNGEIATGCWIAGALLPLGAIVFRKGALILNWVIFSIYLLMLAAFIYFMMTWKMTRLF